MARRNRDELANTSLPDDFLSGYRKVASNNIDFSQPERQVRWVDKSNKVQEYSLCSSVGQIAESRTNLTVWYNFCPEWLYPLLDDFCMHLQIYANSTKLTRSQFSEYANGIGVFLKFLLCDKNSPYLIGNEIISFNETKLLPSTLWALSIKDITHDILLLFELYLLKVYNYEKLQSGGSNKNTWANSVSPLFNYLLRQNNNQKLLHYSIIENGVPLWGGDSNNSKKTTEPYSDIEMYQIILAAEHDCKVIRHNWATMREIGNIRIGSWENLEDFCWFLVNIVWNTKPESIENADRRKAAHWAQRYKLKLPYSTKNEFYVRYTKEEIIALSKNGTTPTISPRFPINELNTEGQKCLARILLRKKFEPCIDAYNTIAEDKECDIMALMDKIRLNMKSLGANERKLYTKDLSQTWQQAGFLELRGRGYPFQNGQFLATDNDKSNASWALLHGLFVPTLDMIYPFLLFTHCTAGNNRHVISSIKRTCSDDLAPENIVYWGTKTKTGNGSIREEDIVTLRKEYEPDGIDDMLSFVNEITAPLVKFAPNAQKEFLFIGRFTGSNKNFISDFSTDHLHTSSKYFCQRHKLLEFTKTTIDKKNANNLIPMLSINAFRVRESNIFNRYNAQPELSSIRRAVQDKDLDTIFKYYLNSNVQRRQNTLSIAALQELLISEIKAFNTNNRFQGEIILSGQINDAESSQFTNVCANNLDSDAPGQTKNKPCKAHFKHCMGCKQSRVFREHLPAICFLHLQLLNKKNNIETDVWENEWLHHLLRVEDCLNRWRSSGEEYSSDVDRALEKALSGNIILIPLV
ncbi:hypothetical protein [Vibrio diazotrophicus]|uniref:hypothetical protein n=1 Tax=Vibrio diazotrophicus TaxID=685 RepID=UPI000C9E053E|nr:hypothetical protein [Vibrio diazotrophicus]PNH83422.1 hypothetical protein C1N27_02265 [Vibrio diazotrophicus]